MAGHFFQADVSVRRVQVEAARACKTAINRVFIYFLYKITNLPRVMVKNVSGVRSGRLPGQDGLSACRKNRTAAFVSA